MFVAMLGVLLLGADAKINAPDKAPTAQFVLIDGSESTGKLTWHVPDRSVSVFTSPCGTQIVIYCPTAKNVKIKATATDGKDHSADAVIVEFVGDGVHPSPGPKPGPKPGPGNTLPQGKFGISDKVRDEAMKPDAPDRKDDVKNLIAAIETLQAKFHAGAVNPKAPLQVSAAIEKTCLLLPQEQQKRWLPTFGAWWTTLVRDTWDAQKLDTKEDWIAFLDETIVGLKAVP